MLSCPAESSPERQRAAVHKRLSLVADEICRILETLLDEYESEVSGSREESELHHRPLDVTLTAELHTTGIYTVLHF